MWREQEVGRGIRPLLGEDEDEGPDRREQDGPSTGEGRQASTCVRVRCAYTS